MSKIFPVCPEESVSRISKAVLQLTYVLNRNEMALVTQKRDFHKSLGDVDAVNGAQRVQRVDVGGSIFASDFSLVKDSYFGPLFSGDFAPEAAEPDAPVFVDRDPALFARVLDFVRNGKGLVPEADGALQRELSFYGLLSGSVQYYISGSSSGGLCLHGVQRDAEFELAAAGGVRGCCVGGEKDTLYVLCGDGWRVASLWCVRPAEGLWRQVVRIVTESQWHHLMVYVDNVVVVVGEHSVNFLDLQSKQCHYGNAAVPWRLFTVSVSVCVTAEEVVVVMSDMRTFSKPRGDSLMDPEVNWTRNQFTFGRLKGHVFNQCQSAVVTCGGQFVLLVWSKTCDSRLVMLYESMTGEPRGLYDYARGTSFDHLITGSDGDAVLLVREGVEGVVLWRLVPDAFGPPPTRTRILPPRQSEDFGWQCQQTLWLLTV